MSTSEPTTTHHDAKDEHTHVGRNGHKLRKLTDRLTLPQQAKRLERMEHRNAVSREHQATRQAIMATVNMVGRLDRKLKTVRLVAFGAAAVVAAKLLEAAYLWLAR